MKPRLVIKLLNLVWYRWTPTGPVVSVARFAPHGQPVRIRKGEVVKPRSGSHGVYSSLVVRRV